MISKAEVDYASMVKHVIKKYSLCSIFIKNIYAEENVTNELTKLSERLNTLRNGMSHGKVKVDFTSDNTKDLKLLEIVVYVVILSEFGIDEDNMIRKIIWLFNIRPFFN